MQDIVEWTKHFLRYKDAVERRIEDIEAYKEVVLVKLKNGDVQKYYCSDKIEGVPLEFNIKIVCLNTKENVDWLYRHWDDLVKVRCSILFANVLRHQSWAIHPWSHNSIVERTDLKAGLYSLFQSVPESY